MNLEQTIALRANVNFWIGENFPERRKYISHSNPVKTGIDKYQIDLHLKNNGTIVQLGRILVDSGNICLMDKKIGDIDKKLAAILESGDHTRILHQSLESENYQFHFDDGIQAVGNMPDNSIDLLLTDPPYSISKSYVCESQIPRRLRKSGRDFIMPKGHFGEWDNVFPAPEEWTEIILPKVKGWAVIFCAHAQIGEYCQILENQKFVAVGPMVWHKTNPVPFNHKFKPVNAWEAIVTGKRSGTGFNGHAVHNVFTCKSPSPQQRIHSTQKPEELLTEFVKLFSMEKDLVVDPFAGSGSTILAAAKQNRKAVGYENDPAMFAKAVKRIQENIPALCIPGRCRKNYQTVKSTYHRP